jgi:hypothetical protein
VCFYFIQNILCFDSIPGVSFQVTHNDLGSAWTTFKRWDYMKEGKIAINDLFNGILNEERNMYTDAILELLEIKAEEKVLPVCKLPSKSILIRVPFILFTRLILGNLFL